MSDRASERKHAEAAPLPFIRDGEERRLFKAIVEASQEAVAISDPEGRLVYVNPAHERLFGRPLEEARQSNYRDYYPPESVEILDRTVAPALARGESWEGELDAFDADGRRFPLWERADSLRDADGNLLYSFGFMHDISKRRELEDAIRRHRDHLEGMVAARTAELTQANEDLKREIAKRIRIEAKREQAQEELQEANARLQVLRQVTAAVHSSLDPKEVFKQITEGTVHALGYTTAFILTLDDAEERLEVRALSTNKPLLSQINEVLGVPLRAFSFPAYPEVNAVAGSLRRGKSVVARTLAEIAYPIIDQDACAVIQRLTGTKHYIVTPLHVEGELIGGMVIASARARVSQEELRSLDALARSASIAIKNAYLHTRTEQAQAALQESERRYRSLVENLPHSLFRQDREGRITFGNRVFLESAGVPPEDVVGTSAHDFFPGEIADKHLADTEHVLRSGEPLRLIEEHRIPATGERRYVEVVKAPIRDAEGEITEVQGIYWDVTELVHLQEKLRRREQEIRAIAENVPALVSYVDADGYYRFANRQYEEWFGISRTDIVGKHYKEILGQATYDTIRQHVEAALAGHRVRYEEALPYARGGTRWVLADYVPDADDQGEIQGFFALVTDITERKRAEQALEEQTHALRESEERFRSFAENAAALVCEVDAEGRYLYVNPAYTSALGYKPQELLGRQAAFLLHPDEVAPATEGFEHLLKDDRPSSDVWRFRHRDGEWRWFHCCGNTFRTAGGEQRIVVVSTDITEQKRAQNALRESEANLARAQRVAHVGNWDWDVKAETLTWSDELYRIFGIEQGFELTYGAIEAMVHPDDRETSQSYANRLLTGDGSEDPSDPYEVEFRIIRPDGAVRHIFQNAEILRGEAGNASRVFGIMQDITERKRAEQAQRESEERYRRIVETAHEGIWIIDAESNTVFANNRMAAMLGCTVDEMKSMSMFAFIDEEWKSIAAGNVERRRRGIAEQHDFKFRRKDGTALWTVVSTNPLFDEEGQYASALAMITDITERKRAEQALAEQTHALRRRNKELAALNAIAAAVSETLDVQEVLDRALDKVLETTGMEAGSMYLMDPRAEVLVLATYRGVPEEFAEKVRIFKMGQSLAGRVAQSGEPIVLDDVSDDPRVTTPLVRGEGIRAFACVAMKSRDEVQGVMTIGSHRVHPFGPEDVQLYTAIANQIGMAIENAQLFEQVRAGREQLARLTQRLVSAQEEERAWLARELHDELGQALTGVGFDLLAIEKEWPPEVAARARERLVHSRAILAEIDDRVSDMALDLRPSMLDDLGLLPALRWHVKRYTWQTGIDVELEAAGFEERLAQKVATAVYRVIQEALTNVAKHAEASRVSVRLKRRESTVVAVVQDNGQGFEASRLAGAPPLERGAGLLGIRERVALLGGTSDIQSQPGQGTRVTVEVPT